MLSLNQAGRLCFQLRKLDAMFDAVTCAINLCGKKTEACCNFEQTPCLEEKICSYFQEGDTYDTPNKMSQSRYVQSTSTNSDCTTRRSEKRFQ